ncbi:helix-turn-helix domain-containing protein [Streptomyces sp. NPDC057257]|uniref:helix-turn-helix domain-containing protein n=1 Tax=Streptomyces sp. NPDC057257 TaxID=3346071 RepID=UPI00362B653B
MSESDGVVQGSWLQLLMDGAELSDLEAFRARSVAAASPGPAARVESDARRALHLHALLAERKRHADELTVLNDLARQLAALRDPHVVLTEIAVQTRRLLAVDVAYVMLTRDDDVLRIEVVDGSMSDALRGIELPRGIGLGGHVLATGNAYWSEDYVQDRFLAHKPAVDDAAVSERLGGILGVPLRVGDVSIGVLLAADRSPRKFSDHEVGLLTSLAAHGAVAIHNAELFDQYQRAAEEIQRTVDLHERLTRTLLGGAGLAEVVQSLALVLDAGIVVLDAEDEVTCSTGADANAAWSRVMTTGDSPVEGSPERRFRHPAERRTQRGRVSSAEYVGVAPIVVSESYAGCVVALRERAVDDATVRLLEIGATSVGLVLASDRAVAEAERRAHGEFVAELLGGHTDDSTISRRAGIAGINLGDVGCVAVFRSDSDDTAAMAAGSRLARQEAGWSAQYGGSVVVLLPTNDALRVRDDVRRRDAQSHAVTVCVAGADGTASGVRAAYRQAHDGTALLLALGRQGACASSGELGIYQSLFNQVGRGGLRSFVDSTVGALLRHDQRHHAELVPTLETYLASSCRHTATASALRIHVNTLYQRLSRIADVMGEDWKEPDRALEIQLALRLHRLSESLSDRR